MLSPDPVTQAPENGQNYNRYTYAFNNPLKYTDPSGYNGVTCDLFDFICGTWSAGGSNPDGVGFDGSNWGFVAMVFADFGAHPEWTEEQAIERYDYWVAKAATGDKLTGLDPQEVFSVVNGSDEESAIAYEWLGQLLNTKEGRRLYEDWSTRNDGMITIDISCTGCDSMNAAGWVDENGTVHVSMSASADDTYPGPFGIAITPDDPRVTWAHEIFGHVFAEQSNTSHPSIAIITNKIMGELDPGGYVPEDPAYSCQWFTC